MKRIAFIVIGLLLLGLCTTHGCGPRIEVAKRNALEKIDSLIGSLDVQREEIKQSMHSLKEMITGIKKSEIKATVKLEQINREIQPIQDRVNRSETSLAKIKEYLEADEAVTLAGKEYSQDDLNDMAEKVLQERENALIELNGLSQSQKSVKSILSSLVNRRLDYQSKISRLDSKVSEIDSQMVAVKAMQDASAEFGDSDLTLDENVNDLESKIDDLLSEVRTEMLTENARWDAETTNREIDSVEGFIDATQDGNGTLDKINEILGDSAEQD